MFYNSTPDAAVFHVPGHTISVPLKRDVHGRLVDSVTGEPIEDCTRYADEKTFFQDGRRIAEAV